MYTLLSLWTIKLHASDTIKHEPPQTSVFIMVLFLLDFPRPLCVYLSGYCCLLLSVRHWKVYTKGLACRMCLPKARGNLRIKWPSNWGWMIKFELRKNPLQSQTQTCRPSKFRPGVALSNLAWRGCLRFRCKEGTLVHPHAVFNNFLLPLCIYSHII